MEVADAQVQCCQYSEMSKLYLHQLPWVLLKAEASPMVKVSAAAAAAVAVI